MDEEKKKPHESSTVSAKDGEAPRTESPKVEKKENESATAEGKTQKNEGDQVKEIEGTKQENEEAVPPEIQSSLETALEEIDKFLSTLRAKNNEENVKASLEVPETVIGKFLDLFEEQLTKHGSAVEGKEKGSLDPEDVTLLLNAVNRVSKLAASVAEMKSDADKKQCVLINRIGAIKQRAMCILEDEFRSILEYVPDLPDPKTESKETESKETEEFAPAEEDFTNYSGHTPEMLSSLNKIAREMISGEYESECVHIYMMIRRIMFDDTLNHTGFEKFSFDDVQKMSWESLEREIATWISALAGCTIMYFPGEKKLAESVFTDYPMISSSIFINLTRGVTIQLLYFAEAMAMTKRSAEKLFKVLDMYETLRDNMVAIQELCPGECSNEVKTEMATARMRLGEAAISMLSDLENSIKSDTAKTTVPGGAVHPLTRYTMNYLKYTCEYKSTLEEVFKEHWKIERSDSRMTDYEAGEVDQNSVNSSSNNDEENQRSPFTNQLVRVMDLLDSNLEGKAKLYRDIPLSSIFLMNNGRYILQKIKGSSEIHVAMGDTWCRKKSTDLRNYHKNYQRETWGRLLNCLTLDGLMEKGKVQKPVLKERFKNFSAMFDEIHRTQSTWIVSDDQLQSELKISISAVVIPAYRSFVGRFSQYLDPGRQTEKYIKYQPEDIETYIDELFEGNRKP
ncbi:exocyst complex component EXO70B1-like [Mangifera indica]|uniref:exocyst complex component EXO70B1-like n=1 Tax=Mangifera indica TaxID=29780 RepID=UPI001CFBEA71|nr:exocyst complex component EXO70B1-like [Mangifera indica]